MWFFLLFGFPILEVWVLFKVGERIGLANTFFALLASAVVGIGLIRTQGLFLLRNFQASLAKGETPPKSIFNSLLIFLAGGLFIFPGYISDFIALLLVLPGSRHLIAYFMRRKLAQKMREGSVRFQGFSSGFGVGFDGGFTPGPPSSSPIRDVTPFELHERSRDVIDVVDVSSKKSTPDID